MQPLPRRAARHVHGGHAHREWRETRQGRVQWCESRRPELGGAIQSKLWSGSQPPDVFLPDELVDTSPTEVHRDGLEPPGCARGRRGGRQLLEFPV